MSAVVTVGLPFYNNAATLSDAVRSVFAQTLEDWTLWLLDDGSTDESAEIAAAFTTDPRVRLLRDGQRRYLAARLNWIARTADTPFVARMDADDLMHPQRLARQIDVLRQRSTTALVATGAYVLDGAGRLQGQRRRVAARLDRVSILRHGAPIIHSALCGRTEWFRENPYNESLPRLQDLELWLRTAPLEIAVLDEPLLFYREPCVKAIRLAYEVRPIERQIMRNTVKGKVPSVEYARAVARSYVKQILYRLLPLELAQALVGRRYIPLSPQSSAHANAALRIVRETPIPGDRDWAPVAC